MQMTTLIKPPRILQRSLDQRVYQLLLAEGYSEVVARVAAGRPRPERGIQALMKPTLSQLDSPFSLKDINIAVERLLLALEREEIIGIETDHDCDGQTSHAVLYESLTTIFQVPPARIRSYVGHRLQEGYGLSEKLMHRILADDPRPTVIMTADNGSSDERQIAKLKAEGIDVIVTDHHGLPIEGPPKSALACINPTRETCEYPDTSIAGCMVSWLLMAALRRKAIERGLLPKDAPALTQVLDFVAVGTVADCVSLARSQNNRAVVQYGLSMIQRLERPCWRAIQTLVPDRALTFEDLGFLIGPLLNSDGRLGDAFQSVNFLLATSDEEAMAWLDSLRESNQVRKAIEKQITRRAEQEARVLASQGRHSLVIFLEEGHSGVHGISASRIKDQFGLPTFIMTHKQDQPGVVTGSGRSIEGLHLREVLQAVEDASPGVFIGFGGHAGAAGVTLKAVDVDRFSWAFEQAVMAYAERANAGLATNAAFGEVNQPLESPEMTLPAVYFGPTLMTDGQLDASAATLETVRALKQLEPFGREFDAPQFHITATVVSLKPMGTSGEHFKLLLDVGHRQWLEAVWFFADTVLTESDLRVKQSYDFLIRLQENHYQQRVSLQAQIVHWIR